MQGTINVEEVMTEAVRLRRWLERARRARLHREEQEALQAYWRASDKQAVVEANREVFERIAENKRRGEKIRAEERRIVERYKQVKTTY